MNSRNEGGSTQFIMQKKHVRTPNCIHNFFGMRCGFPFSNVGNLVFIPIPNSRSLEFYFPFPFLIPTNGIFFNSQVSTNQYILYSSPSTKVLHSCPLAPAQCCDPVTLRSSQPCYLLPEGYSSYSTSLPCLKGSSSSSTGKSRQLKNHVRYS